MTSGHSTLEQTWPVPAREQGAPPVPGLLLVFSGSLPLFAALPLRENQLEVHRGPVGSIQLTDGCLSRRHAEVTWEPARWTVRDLGSRNGTFVDGVRVTDRWTGEKPQVLRAGDTLLLFQGDVNPYRGGVEREGGQVVGPKLRLAWRQIEAIAGSGDVLHVRGETGAGKELAARLFHRAGPAPAGPFVPVNCAAIPPELAERLLFGARKGAYSGADADADGYVQAADGGTLFLDEVAELPLPVQAKLLRVLESREVLPLGASKPRKVSLRLCSATHGDLRARVGAGSFREDLFFRLARPEVALPPLRERAEEIPWLLEEELGRSAPGLGLHASLVEAALLRPWPGNVRELLREAAMAARAALAEGTQRVESRHLSASAGRPISTTVPGTLVARARVQVPMLATPAAGSPAAMLPPPPPRPPPAASTVPPLDRTPPADRPGKGPDRARIESELQRAQGNVAAAARALGVHRTQLRRWLQRLAIDPRRFGTAGEAAGEGTEYDDDTVVTDPPEQ